MRILIVPLLLLVSGCAEQLGGPVEGTVTLDGQPLPAAQVYFEAASASGGRVTREQMYVGRTDDAGHYALRQPGADAQGVPPGEYRVRISTAVAPPNADELTPIPPEQVPPQYRDGSETFTVPSEGTTSADFAFESP